jgi:hypothetical protein
MLPNSWPTTMRVHVAESSKNSFALVVKLYFNRGFILLVIWYFMFGEIINIFMFRKMLAVKWREKWWPDWPRYLSFICGQCSKGRKTSPSWSGWAATHVHEKTALADQVGRLKVTSRSNATTPSDKKKVVEWLICTNLYLGYLQTFFR